MSKQPTVDDWDERAEAARGVGTGEPIQPWLLVGSGAVAAMIAALLLAAGGLPVVAWLVLYAGSAVGLVGLVALGTMLGLQRQRWLDRQRRR